MIEQVLSYFYLKILSFLFLPAQLKPKILAKTPFQLNHLCEKLLQSELTLHTDPRASNGGRDHEEKS